MNTKAIELDQEKYNPDLLKEPAEALKNGKLVIFPTETVYGIGVDLDNESAVNKLYEIKRRPRDKLITIHIGESDDILKYVKKIPPCVQRLINKFWPGPLTIIFPDNKDGIGIRYPNHKLACELIRLAGIKVGAPSANISGDQPSVNPQQVLKDFMGKVAYIITAGETRFKNSSTVIRITDKRTEIVRKGAIPSELIEEVNYKVILLVCTGNTCRSPMATTILKELLARKYSCSIEELEKKSGYKVISAGTNAAAGFDMTYNSVTVLEELGYNPETHRSRPLTISIVEEADCIFVMEDYHKNCILKLQPESEDKIKFLHPDGKEIADPISGDIDVYRSCVSDIRQSLIRRIKEF